MRPWTPAGLEAGSTVVGHTATMVPFLVAEALRRARRGHREEPVGHRGGPPMLRLLAGEVRHVATSSVLTPRGVAVVCGAVAAMGVVVALGPAYPGPVVPSGLRWLLAAVVAGGAVGLTRTAPHRWRDLRRAVRRARVGLVAVVAAAALSLFKVGLHEVTPGPVLPGPVRWAAVSAVLVGAILVAGHDRTHGS